MKQKKKINPNFISIHPIETERARFKKEKRAHKEQTTEAIKGMFKIYKFDNFDYLNTIKYIDEIFFIFIPNYIYIK